MALTNAQYDRVMRYYDDRRTLRRLEAEERLGEVEAAIPAYKPLLQEITSLYTAEARDRLLHPDSPDPALRDRLSLCLKKKQTLLSENGFAPDYTEIRYDCPKCRDTGYIDGRKCDCFAQAVVTCLYRDHFSDKIPPEHDFDHFKTDWYSDTIGQGSGDLTPRRMAEKALEAAKACAAALSNKEALPVHLLICGQAGVGKTHLSEAILLEAAKTGHPGLYFSAQEFFDLLADAAFDRSEEASLYASLVRTGDLLVIDDLGTELLNSLVEAELFRVLNDRTRAGRTTVISTNLTLNEMAERYSERVFSRLVGGFQLIKLAGDDIRLKKLLKTEA